MEIALTFDDGPNTVWTPVLLDVLHKHDVCATFFMIGEFVKRHPELAQTVARAGHQIANHTATHPKLTEIPLTQATIEVSLCERILTKVVGDHSNLFRPPFILTSPMIEAMVEEQGLITVLFQASAGDAGLPRGVDFMFEKVVRELRGRSGIILMHDGSHLGDGADRRDTIGLTDRLITHFKSLGAQFVFTQEV